MKAKARNPERCAVLLLCVAGALAGCAGEGRAGPGLLLRETPEDRACRIDADCTVVHLPCHGWRAVRTDRAAAFSARYDEDNRDELRRSDCAGPGDAPAPVATCRAGACALPSAATPAGKP